MEIKNTTIFSGSFECFTIAFVFVVALMISPFLHAQSSKPFTVVLDAGHGGKDPGNRGNGYYEKHIALKVVLKIGAILERNKDIKVLYTRKSDVFLELNQRASIANKSKADLFVSIHCDAHNSNAYGAGTFVLGLHENDRNFRIAQKENSVIFLEDDYEKKYDGFDPNNPESVISLVLMQETYLDQSIDAANTIQQSFVKNLKRKNRTVKQAGFLVLRNTYMPSVLVELGFLTNKTEGAYLNSKKGQDQMSEAIAKAIIAYKNNIFSTLQFGEVFEESSPNTPPQQPTEPSQVFRVQIAASTNKLATTSSNFKGLNPIYRLQKGSIYRYYFGNTSGYQQALSLRDQARKKGYKDCFVVAFENGVQIPLTNEMKRK
ncbi:MAG: N-acetylmuramoyl-L-alanine amidase [Flavobacteriaceae bacterium]